MKLRLSNEPGVYGTVNTTLGEIQVLLSEGETDDGIRIERGGPSTFSFFVFIPTGLREDLVAIHSEEVFQEAVVRVCELLDQAK
jgi:hypothetical protein